LVWFLNLECGGSGVALQGFAEMPGKLPAGHRSRQQLIFTSDDQNTNLTVN
jgi:hypothetical protein